MREETGEWLKQADYDFGTAKAMFTAERYIYSLFMCHLAIEKSLKALLIEKSGEIPPRTHNLILLLKTIKTNLSSEQLSFLASLNAMSVTTRYPDDLSRALKDFTQDLARDALTKTEEVLICLKQGLTP